MVFIISETLIIFLLMHFIAKLTKENEELKEDIFSLKVQATSEDFYSDRNKKKSVKTFRYKNYQVKKNLSNLIESRKENWKLNKKALRRVLGKNYGNLYLVFIIAQVAEKHKI